MDRGEVDHRVEPSEPLHGGIDRAFAIVRVRDVRRERNQRVARSRMSGFDGVGTQIERENPMPLRRQVAGAGLSDAARGTGDDHILLFAHLGPRTLLNQ